MSLPNIIHRTQDNVQYQSTLKKIGLIGCSGFGNLGDGAIQEAIIQKIHQYCPNAHIYGFSLNTDDTEARYQIPSFPIGRQSNGTNNSWWQARGNNASITSLNRALNRMRSFPLRPIRKLSVALIGTLLELLAWIRAYQNLKGFDLLIVSGGGQLDDYWGGAWMHPYTLFMWGLLAKLRNVKYCIVSVGAGPLDTSLSRLFIKGTLALANYRSYRDENSKQFIEQVVGFKVDDPVYPDLAHSLELDNYLKWPILRDNPLVVGIGPMLYLAPEGLQGRNSSLYQVYLNKLACFVTWLLQNQYKILFFSSETHEGLHDRHVIEDLKGMLSQTRLIAQEQQIIENPIQTLDDLMLQLARTDLVVASRFHGVLLPMLLNKPVLALSYHPKIDHLMAETGQAEYCLSIEDFDVETLKERFTKLETNQESIKKQLAERIQEYRTALDEQYERLFKNL